VTEAKGLAGVGSPRPQLSWDRELSRGISGPNKAPCPWLSQWEGTGPLYFQASLPAAEKLESTHLGRRWPLRSLGLPVWPPNRPASAGAAVHRPPSCRLPACGSPLKEGRGRGGRWCGCCRVRTSAAAACCSYSPGRGSRGGGRRGGAGQGRGRGRPQGESQSEPAPEPSERKAPSEPGCSWVVGLFPTSRGTLLACRGRKDQSKFL
jgi:hypothetical protein